MQSSSITSNTDSQPSDHLSGMQHNGLLVIDECYHVVGRISIVDEQIGNVLRAKEIETNTTKIIKIFEPSYQFEYLMEAEN
jgi:hypothetical protein